MAAVVPLLSVPPLCVCLRTLSRRRAQRAPLSRVRQTSAVLLPESFRGGCSFGVGRPISPAIVLVCANFRFAPVFRFTLFHHSERTLHSFESL
jgi:hypothetical protein